VKHYKLVEFLSNLNVKQPLHERKALAQTKSPPIDDFWRRFWFPLATSQYDTGKKEKQIICKR